jgi:hypothetical protein
MSAPLTAAGLLGSRRRRTLGTRTTDDPEIELSAIDVHARHFHSHALTESILPARASAHETVGEVLVVIEVVRECAHVH